MNHEPKPVLCYLLFGTVYGNCLAEEKSEIIKMLSPATFSPMITWSSYGSRVAALGRKSILFPIFVLPEQCDCNLIFKGENVRKRVVNTLKCSVDILCLHTKSHQKLCRMLKVARGIFQNKG